MADSPLFSVLLPTHARADVIGYAIKSVLAQTEQSFEILVVGDGAEQGTFSAVQACDDARIRWFDLPKAPGFGYANRNTALRQASGRYIAHMSDDDLILPGHLAALRAALDGGAKIACTRALWISSDGIGCPFPNNLSLKDELDTFTTRFNTLPSSCFAYQRDALDDPDPWPTDGKPAGDLVLWRRIMAKHPHIPLKMVHDFSVLHFSAKRKKSRSSGMHEVRAILAIADKSPWWPVALSPPIGEGVTEQSVWWANISRTGGVEALHQAIAVVTDRLAWMLVQSCIPAQARKLILPQLGMPKMTLRSRLSVLGRWRKFLVGLCR